MATDFSPEQMALVMSALQNNSMDFGNYNANTGVLGFDAAGSFDAAGNFMGRMPKPGWANNGDTSALPSNFSFNLQYKANPAPGPGYPGPTPVEVLIFQSTFIPKFNGVFLTNGNLQFTNEWGDTVTLKTIGRNAPSYQGFVNIVETEAMNISFVRCRMQSESQKDFEMTFSDRSQFNSSHENGLSPMIYDNQYTFRPLLQDIPINTGVSKKKGIIWTVGTTETGPGLTMSFFTDIVISPDQALKNKPMVQMQGPPAQFQAPIMPLVNPGFGQVNPQAAVMMQQYLQAKNVTSGRG